MNFHQSANRIRIWDTCAVLFCYCVRRSNSLKCVSRFCPFSQRLFLVSRTKSAIDFLLANSFYEFTFCYCRFRFFIFFRIFPTFRLCHTLEVLFSLPINRSCSCVPFWPDALSSISISTVSLMLIFFRRRRLPACGLDGKHFSLE